MANHREPELGDPDYNLGALHKELSCGKLRWPFTVFAFLGIVLITWLFVDPNPPAIEFPIHLEGKTAKVVCIVVTLLWAALAATNWRSHRKTRVNR